MNIDLKLISSRLAQARSLQEVSLDFVCGATGISIERLAKIEAGSVAPSGDELLILANYFRRDFRDFVDRGRPEPFRQTDILYRRLGESFSSEDRRAVQEFLFLCEIEADLQRILGVNEDHFSFQPLKGDLHKVHGAKAASALRIFLGYVGAIVPLNIYEDFRRIGVHVFRRRLSMSEISGLYIEHPIAGHCVLVNYSEDVYRQRFSVAHEVAHAIFDSSESVRISYKKDSSQYDRNDLREVRANYFASNYLMPPECLPNVRQWDVDQAIYWAKAFNVSTAALSYALQSANRVDGKTANMIRSVRVPLVDKIDPEAPAYLNDLQRTRRQKMLEQGLSDYYVNLCFEANHRGLISSGRLSEALLSDHAGAHEIGAIFGRRGDDGI